MKLTRDEAFRLQDSFEEYIQEAVGEDVTFKRTESEFSIVILRQKPRKPHPKPVPPIQEHLAEA